MKTKTETSPVFGARLQAARRAAGMTQEQVAEVIHVDRSTYTKYETGSNEPSLVTAYRLAALFSTTLDELLRPE